MALAASLAASAGMSAAGAPQDELTNPRARAVFEYFKARSADFDEFLRQERPAALSAAARAVVVLSLPEEGELTPTAAHAAKLAALRPVLAFHEREHHFEYRLIEVGPQAAIGLYARTVLLFSRDAMELLNVDELRAVTAHEIAHDYVWDEYEHARSRGDTARLQELELRCDGIAVITLQRLGLDPKHLSAAVTKTTRYNERAGAVATRANYAPLPHRQRFLRAMIALVARTAADSGGR